MRRYRRDEMFCPEVPINISRGTHHDPVAMHNHDFLELVLIVRGNAVHTIHFGNGKSASYSVLIGDVFSIMPDERHGYINSRDIYYYNISVGREFIVNEEPLLSKLKSWDCLMPSKTIPRSKIHLSLRERIIAENCVIRIMNELSQRRDNYELFVKSAFLQFLIIVARHDIQVVSEGDKVNNSGIAIAISMMEDEPQQHFRMGDLAKTVAMSPSLYYAKFREATGMSPADYLINLRLGKACDMLINSDQPLSQIAYSCGFCDSNYLIKAFRARHGITPAKYRRQFQQ